jgi:hypothetical protein
MRKGIFIGLILASALIAVSSCRDKQEKVIVDYDALRPTAIRKTEIDPDTVTIPALTPADVSISFRPLFEIIYEKDFFIPSDKELYPYRFGAKEYLAVTQHDVNENPLGTWYFLLYQDSVMTDNAYLNWMDCFGKDCQNLGLGSGDNIAENTGQIWSNDTLIVAYIGNQGGTFYPKENAKIDKAFKDDLRYGLKWSRGQTGSWSGKMIRK